MKWWQYILLPFAYLYGGILWFRRGFYLTGIFKRKQGSIKSLIVGNLQVGGAGKTPMAMWLANELGAQLKLAILSRGYGRKTSGFFEVKSDGIASEYGDEPLEMRQALNKNIPNFVCENRIAGIEGIKNLYPQTDLVLLDDAYQHLKLKGDFYLLLTEYRQLFTRDFPMPSGRLREFASAAKDADAIVISKCPADLDGAHALDIYRELMPFGKPVFYAAYDNAIPVNFKGETLATEKKVVLVSALANNHPFLHWAGRDYKVAQYFSYADHRAFHAKDIEQWQIALTAHQAEAILTTRKDFMRMKHILPPDLPVYYTYTQPVFLFDGTDTLLALIHKRLDMYESGLGN